MSETPNPPNSTPTPPVTPTPVPAPNQSQIRQWHMWCHLSGLVMLTSVPGVVGPLVIWLIKKDEIPSIVPHGKAAVNFHLTVLIANLASAALVFVLLCFGWIMIPVIFAINICAIVFTIIAGLRANEGREYRYPCSLNLIS